MNDCKHFERPDKDCPWCGAASARGKRFQATPTSPAPPGTGDWVVNDTLLHRVAAVFTEADYGFEAQEQAEIDEVIRNREYEKSWGFDD